MRIYLALWHIGLVGVFLLGLALAIDIDGYEIWSAWVLIAIALWMTVGGFGDRLPAAYKEAERGIGHGKRSQVALDNRRNRRRDARRHDREAVGMIGPAAIRPDEWDVPLFLHVLGALALIGTLALAYDVPVRRRPRRLGREPPPRPEVADARGDPRLPRPPGRRRVDRRQGGLRRSRRPTEL